jgi:molecular chaperone GrpE
MEEQAKEKLQNRNSQEDWEGKLQECERQKAEYLAGWQRARADLLNYKKEELERIGQLLGYAKEEFLLHLLPLLDNIELAENALPESLKNEEYVKGLLQIGMQLRDFLKSQGVQEVKSIGEKFDPNFHEIVEEQEKEGVESGIVIEEVQKGYLLAGKLLRPAKVKVAK